MSMRGSSRQRGWWHCPNGECLIDEWIYKLVLVSLSATISSSYFNASGSFTFWKMYSLAMKIIYILCVFNIIINTSFLVFALDLGKWHRIICTSSINAEIDSVSRKRMSKLMKFYILLCCNVLVALCQK